MSTALSPIRSKLRRDQHVAVRELALGRRGVQVERAREDLDVEVIDRVVVGLDLTILRSLMIASGHELAPVALAERLGELRQIGWLEDATSEAGSGRRDWRLTDGGRSAV